MQSRREAAKAERRARIIRAARELIRETGSSGLSMRALAARAGVSLATPYNLFGSKGAVLVAVLEDIKGFGSRFAAYRGRDPLERAVCAAELAVAYYEEDPEFYRALWTCILGSEGAEARSALFNPKRDAFWLGLLKEAQDAGLLLPEIDLRLLMRSLDHGFRSAMLHWVLGDLPLAALRPATAYAYALTLRGAATADAQAGLLALALERQQAMAAAADDTGAALPAGDAA